MRNPSIWYSEDPLLERAVERAAQLREDWAVANRRRYLDRQAADGEPARPAHGIRYAIGHAAVAIGRAIGGPQLAEEEEAAESDDWAAAA